MNCEIYAAFVVVFVIGYAMAWYKYNAPPVHVVVRKESPLPPLATPIAKPGPGSERFHTGGDDGPLDAYDGDRDKDDKDDKDQDHDNQVISRMRK